MVFIFDILRSEYTSAVTIVQCRRLSVKSIATVKVRFLTTPKAEIYLKEAKELSVECSRRGFFDIDASPRISILIAKLESTGPTAWNLYRGMTLTRMRYSTFVERPFSPSRAACNLTAL